MIQEISIFDIDRTKKEIIHVESSIPDLALEDPHVGASVGDGDQPRRHPAHQEQVKIIERENPEKSPPVKLNKIFPGRERTLHIEQDAGDQEPGQNKEELHPHPTEAYILCVKSKNK